MRLTLKTTLLTKILLSVFGLYHLVVMLLMPNLTSFLGRELERWIAPYGNSVGLNATWNFFSPDPAHTMYLRYRVYYESAEGEELREPDEFYIPETKELPVKDFTLKRHLYAMRFMIIDPKRLETVLGPWLCRQYPQASLIEMQHFVESVPPLHEARLFEEVPLRELSEQYQTFRVEARCLPQGNL